MACPYLDSAIERRILALDERRDSIPRWRWIRRARLYARITCLIDVYLATVDAETTEQEEANQVTSYEETSGEREERWLQRAEEARQFVQMTPGMAETLRRAAREEES